MSVSGSARRSAEYLHRLHGVSKPRLAYRSGDFVDYVLMILICVLVLYVAYGRDNPLTWLGTVLATIQIPSFVLRHGFELRMPLLLRRPVDFLYVFIYRIQNIRSMYVLALAVLLAENGLIAATPSLPHHTGLMRQVALVLFYSHFVLLTGYRTAILIAHLRERQRIRAFLLQTTWKSALTRQPRISLEIWHAYVIGLLAHILLIAPWYVVITHLQFSVLLLPLVCAANLFTQAKFLKVLNEWFYRDHWLCHNSELEFLYLHGPHHDAIPSGLIGVSGNGHLEGLLRHTLGAPGPFYSPLITFAVYGFEVKGDIDGHQFIPGVYPHVSRQFQEINQHSTHHFGRLEPYSFGLYVNQPHVSQALRDGLKLLPPEIQDSIHLDEEVTGFVWDTPRYRKFLELYSLYENRVVEKTIGH